ncbi:MAG TPA: hypothetical protein VNV41_12975 [Candidatus Acidoferrales bacterium]|jgi:hypothetical protein|nr:hypothetical protein [Candidatus Acidoferrales bacterium]
MSESNHPHKKPSLLGNLVAGISCVDVFRSLVERDGAETVTKALVVVIAERQNLKASAHRSALDGEAEGLAD